MAEKLRAVLDTNALLRCVSRRTAFRPVMDKLYAGDYEAAVTTEILFEYEEKLREIFDDEVAELVLSAFSILSNVKKMEVYYRWRLIFPDEDDNKFVDCAFAFNAHYLVSNDGDLKVLKRVTFPKIQVVWLEKFHEILNAFQ